MQTIWLTSAMEICISQMHYMHYLMLIPVLGIFICITMKLMQVCMLYAQIQLLDLIKLDVCLGLQSHWIIENCYLYQLTIYQHNL